MESRPLLMLMSRMPRFADIENQEIDLERLTGSIDAIQDNGLVCVDELPDGSSYLVASHGLLTFEINLGSARRHPLVKRGPID